MIGLACACVANVSEVDRQNSCINESAFLSLMLVSHCGDYPCKCIKIYTSWRQATPYRRLGFVGDALSITLRRGGLRPASREHADQTSGTHFNTSLTLRETAQPNLTTPPFNPFFTHPSLLQINYPVGVALYSDTPHFPDTYDYIIPCNIV